MSGTQLNRSFRYNKKNTKRQRTAAIWSWCDLGKHQPSASTVGRLIRHPRRRMTNEWVEFTWIYVCCICLLGEAIVCVCVFFWNRTPSCWYVSNVSKDLRVPGETYMLTPDIFPVVIYIHIQSVSHFLRNPFYCCFAAGSYYMCIDIARFHIFDRDLHPTWSLYLIPTQLSEKVWYRSPNVYVAHRNLLLYIYMYL